MIEGDLRAVRSAPIAPAQAAPPLPPRRSQPRAEAPALRRRPGDGAAAETRIAESGGPRASPRASARPFRGRAARIPRRAAAGRAVPAACRHAPSAKSWSRTPRRRALRSNRTCRRIIRSSRARDRPRGCRRPRSASPPRKARSAKSPTGPKKPVSTSSFIAAARRAAQAAAARRPTKEPRARQAKASGQGEAKDQDGRPGALDHHLQDPLAAGRRQRGRDRARHLQDGDDAARHRQRAADAGDGKSSEPAPLGRADARPRQFRGAAPAPQRPR